MLMKILFQRFGYLCNFENLKIRATITTVKEVACTLKTFAPSCVIFLQIIRLEQSVNGNLLEGEKSMLKETN